MIFSLVLMMESLIVNIACYYSTKPIKHYYDSSSQLVFSFSLFALVFSTFESKASVESMCCSKCHLALVDLYHVRWELFGWLCFPAVANATATECKHMANGTKFTLARQFKVKDYKIQKRVLFQRLFTALLCKEWQKGYNEKFFCSKKSSFGVMATKSRTIEHKNKIEQTSYSGPGVFFKVVNFLVLTKT